MLSNNALPMNGVAVFAAATALFAGVAVNVSSANPQTADFVACGAGSTVDGVVRAIQSRNPGGPVDLQAVGNEDYAVQRQSDGVRLVGARSGRRADVRAAASDTRKSCLYFPHGATEVNVDQGGTLPGQNVAALAAVVDYRAQHSWPLGAAHADRSDTTVLLQTRGGHLFVSILDFETLQSCFGEEYYRVDLPSYTVRPYDGCLEGHQHPASLPYSTQLPPR